MQANALSTFQVPIQYFLCHDKLIMQNFALDLVRKKSVALI